MSQPVVSSDEEALIHHAQTGRGSSFLRCATITALVTGVMAAGLLAMGLRPVLTGHAAATLDRSSFVAEPPEAADDADAGSAADSLISLQSASYLTALYGCPIDTSGSDFFRWTDSSGTSVSFCYNIPWPESAETLKIVVPGCICETSGNLKTSSAFVMNDCEDVTGSFTISEQLGCGLSFKCNSGGGSDDDDTGSDDDTSNDEDDTGGSCPQPGDTYTYCFEVADCPGVCEGSALRFTPGVGRCPSVPGPCCGSCPETAAPTSAPTPTAAPTATPTPAPTHAPTAAPTEEAPAPTSTPSPTSAPTPTPAPTVAPTSTPTVLPTASPTSTPTVLPTAFPTPSPPTPSPTTPPGLPTAAPTPHPTRPPTAPDCNVPCSVKVPTGLGLGASPTSLGNCLSDWASWIEGQCIEPDQCDGGGEDDDDSGDRRLTSGRTCETAWEEIQENAGHTGSNPNTTIPCDNLLKILYQTCSPLCFFCHYC